MSSKVHIHSFPSQQQFHYLNALCHSGYPLKSTGPHQISFVNIRSRSQQQISYGGMPSLTCLY